MPNFHISHIPVGFGNPPILIAGPCVLEDEGLAGEMVCD